MQRFISAEGLTIHHFYSAVSKELEAHVDRNRSFASVLLSAVDFDAFCDMMNDVRDGAGVVFCPPLISLEEDFYGDQDSSNEHHAFGKERQYVSQMDELFTDDRCAEAKDVKHANKEYESGGSKEEKGHFDDAKNDDKATSTYYEK